MSVYGRTLLWTTTKGEFDYLKAEKDKKQGKNQQKEALKQKKMQKNGCENS